MEISWISFGKSESTSEFALWFTRISVKTRSLTTIAFHSQSQSLDNRYIYIYVSVDVRVCVCVDGCVRIIDRLYECVYALLCGNRSYKLKALKAIDAVSRSDPTEKQFTSVAYVHKKNIYIHTTYTHIHTYLYLHPII